MTSLDSRYLSYTDCYVQRFTEPGAVRYRLATSAVACQSLDDERTFEIEVSDGKRRKEGRQHDVTVALVDGELVATPERLTIGAGDLVLWHSDGAGVPAYSVQGEGPGGSFDSSAMRAESLYSHAFGTAGDYQWVDANGGRTGGLVRVRDLDPHDRESCDKWMHSLQDGVLVTVDEDGPAPKEVDIVTGQTVFWAVTDAGGISVTDERLLAGVPQRHVHDDQSRKSHAH